MTEQQNEILARLIRNKFDATDDLDYCLQLIGIARKLGFDVLANEMTQDLI